MSTYDAYNLSLRDSTEFTVPTGGGTDENFTTYKLRIKAPQPPSGSVFSNVIELYVPYVFDENCAREFYEGATEDELDEIISFLPRIELNLQAIPDGEWHEYEVIGMNGAVNISITDSNETPSETIVTSMSENVEKIVSSGGDYMFHRITGDAFMEFYGAENDSGDGGSQVESGPSY